ncbi:MAG TPA: aminotransferase class IV [Chitinophagaceae bacterium]|jgi:branched-chain amino acid aminotransferase|nr:aminotransferase class IV [Chitinophagaceae bacterium]
MAQLCFNGDFLPADRPLFPASNRGFRYGDGLFETLRLQDGALPLFPLHMERLGQGLTLLGLEPVSSALELHQFTLQLAAANNCTAAARVRLTVYREENRTASFVIEAAPLDPVYSRLPDEGWHIDLFPFARKSRDAYANLKSANYLPYVLAGRYAAERGLDECLVLNTESRIADGTRTNVFLVRKGMLYTPALHEGCVSGVMRRHLIETGKRLGYTVHLGEITEADLLAADELFLANALMGLRPAASFRTKTYARRFSEQLYTEAVSTIFPPFC